MSELQYNIKYYGLPSGTQYLLVYFIKAYS